MKLSDLQRKTTNILNIITLKHVQIWNSSLQIDPLLMFPGNVTRIADIRRMISTFKLPRTSMIPREYSQEIEFWDLNTILDIPGRFPFWFLGTSPGNRIPVICRGATRPKGASPNFLDILSCRSGCLALSWVREEQGRIHEFKKGGAKLARKIFFSHPPRNCFATPFSHPPHIGQ